MSTSTEEYHKVQDLVAKWREKHQAEEEKIAKLLAELEMLHVKVKAEKAVSKHLEKRVQSLSSEYEMGVRENESLVLQAETLMRKVSMHANENSDLRETIATLQKQAHNNQDTTSPRVNGKQSLEEKRQSPSADVMQLGRQNEPEAKSNSGSSDVEKVHETSPSFSSSSFSSTSSSTSSSSSPPPLHSNGGNTRPIPVMAMKRNQLRSGSSLSLNSLTRDERNERNKAVGGGHMVVTDRSVSTPHHLDHQQEDGDYAKQSHTSGDVGAGSVPSTTRRRGSLRSILKSIDSSSYLLDESDSPQVPSHDGTSRKHSKSYSVDSPVSASSVPTPTLQNRDEENEEAGGDGDRNVGRITRASSLGDTRYLANSGKRVSFGKSQTKEFSADLTVLRGPMMEKCSVVTVSLDLVQKWILTEMDKDGKSTPRGQVPEPVPLSRSSSSSSNSSLSSASMRKVILPPSEVMDIQYNQATKTFSYHNDGVKQQDNRSATHFGNIAEMACPHGVNVIGITDAASRFPLRSVEEHTFMVKDQRNPSKPVTVYGMCRTVYKEVRFKVAPYSYFRCSLPVTFCILSKQSFFDLHFDLLEQISNSYFVEDISSLTNPVYYPSFQEVSRQTVESVALLDIPLAGQTVSVTPRGDETKHLNFERTSISFNQAFAPRMSRMLNVSPYEEDCVRISERFFRLGLHGSPAKVIANLMECALREQHIIVLGSSARVVSAAVLCIPALLQPLQWLECHVTLPVVPDSYITILESPVPYLAGCFSLSHTPFQKDSLPEDIVVWEPETGMLHVPKEFTPSMPGRTRLISDLTEVIPYQKEKGVHAEFSARELVRVTREHILSMIRYANVDTSVSVMPDRVLNFLSTMRQSQMFCLYKQFC